MRIKGKLSYIRLLIPVLLFAGVQIFAQAAANSNMPMAGPASHNTTTAHADLVVISDRTFIMKSIEGIGTVAGLACSSRILSVGVARSFCSPIDCAAPPPGCFYQKPPTGPNGCPTGCGTLVCGPEM